MSGIIALSGLNAMNVFRESVLLVNLISLALNVCFISTGAAGSLTSQMTASLDGADNTNSVTVSSPTDRESVKKTFR